MLTHQGEFLRGGSGGKILKRRSQGQNKPRGKKEFHTLKGQKVKNYIRFEIPIHIEILFKMVVRIHFMV